MHEDSTKEDDSFTLSDSDIQNIETDIQQGHEEAVGTGEGIFRSILF